MSLRAVSGGTGKVRAHTRTITAGSGGSSVGAWNSATVLPPAPDPSRITLTNSDRTATRNSQSPGQAGAIWSTVVAKASGKWYREFVMGLAAPEIERSGLGTPAFDPVSTPGGDSGTTSVGIARGGFIRYNSSWGAQVGVGTFAVGDIAGLALNVATGEIWLSRNGVFEGNPAAGTGAAFSGIDFTAMTPYFQSSSDGNYITIPSVQTYSPPAGFSEWL